MAGRNTEAPPEHSRPNTMRHLRTPGRQPWRAWKGRELAAILGIDNLNSFRVQLSQRSHQGHIRKIGRALYAPALPATQTAC